MTLAGLRRHARRSACRRAAAPLFVSKQRGNKSPPSAVVLSPPSGMRLSSCVRPAPAVAVSVGVCRDVATGRLDGRPREHSLAGWDLGGLSEAGRRRPPASHGLS